MGFFMNRHRDLYRFVGIRLTLSKDSNTRKRCFASNMVGYVVPLLMAYIWRLFNSMVFAILEIS